jgi:hypothetical protein
MTPTSSLRLLKTYFIVSLYHDPLADRLTLTRYPTPRDSWIGDWEAWVDGQERDVERFVTRDWDAEVDWMGRRRRRHWARGVGVLGSGGWGSR